MILRQNPLRRRERVRIGRVQAPGDLRDPLEVVARHARFAAGGFECGEFVHLFFEDLCGHTWRVSVRWVYIEERKQLGEKEVKHKEKNNFYKTNLLNTLRHNQLVRSLPELGHQAVLVGCIEACAEDIRASAKLQGEVLRKNNGPPSSRLIPLICSMR
jgi:hypothetical protein